ncbi:MAG TPA: CopG family transcriptional regulator [Roseiarcus sp.]|nr:CopG family transcriptional regulator [Roseiarcus sp.]
MRTTLDIADDVLAAAKAIANEQRRSTGEVISDLARQGLSRPLKISSRDGVPILNVRDPAVRVTLETVNALRDEAR